MEPRLPLHCAGPDRLTHALAINGKLDGAPRGAGVSVLLLEASLATGRSRRIGIARATHIEWRAHCSRIVIPQSRSIAVWQYAIERGPRSGIQSAREPDIRRRRRYAFSASRFSKSSIRSAGAISAPSQSVSDGNRLSRRFLDNRRKKRITPQPRPTPLDPHPFYNSSLRS